MAQTGYTPIQIYSSSTGGAAPVAGNLTNSTLGSELAINITDGKLFYKDNGGSVQVIAWKTTPTTAGGTGLTSYTAGDLLYYATGTTLAKLTIGASTTVLTSSGTAPQWTAQSALSVGEAANLKSNATTGVMQITGPGAGTTRVMTIPNANFTAARTDAAQTFTGTQSIEGILVARSGNAIRFNNPTNGNWSQISNTSGGEMRLATGSGDSLLLTNFDATLLSGNLIQGTAAKGITTGGSFSLGLGTNGSTTQASIDTSGNFFAVSASGTAGNGNFNNGGQLAALASNASARSFSSIYKYSATNNATVDAWYGRDAAGSVFGNSLLVGHFYVYVNGASGANGFAGVYAIQTTGDGTTAATLTAVSSVTRGTSPVSSVQIANDGVNGAIKLTITYINNSGVVTGGGSTVTFVGQIA